MKQAGHVVLFRFPRTDATRGKLRPALLLAEVPGPYDDWLTCMISSQLHQCIDGFDEVIDTNDDDFDASSLKTSSVIRIGRLAVIEMTRWKDQSGVSTRSGCNASERTLPGACRRRVTGERHRDD